LSSRFPENPHDRHVRVVFIDRQGDAALRRRASEGEGKIMADGIRIVVIIGSVRPGNYTSMAAALVADELRKRPEVSVEVIDPATLHLPFPGRRPTLGLRSCFKKKSRMRRAWFLQLPSTTGVSAAL
jgi:hypothetical protein